MEDEQIINKLISGMGVMQSNAIKAIMQEYERVISEYLLRIEGLENMMREEAFQSVRLQNKISKKILKEETNGKKRNKRN